MNINSDYSESEDQPINAVQAMEMSMSWIFENLIEPQQEDLNEDSLMMLTIIGATFKQMASRADAWDALQQNKDDFSRN